LGEPRVVVATNSKKDALTIIVSYLNQYGVSTGENWIKDRLSETGNEKEVEIASKYPELPIVIR